jgi:hypothetical protein
MPRPLVKIDTDMPFAGRAAGQQRGQWYGRGIVGRKSCQQARQSDIDISE